MSDIDLTAIPIAVRPAHSQDLGDADPLTQLANDIDARFAAGKKARLDQVGALDVRMTAVEARGLVPGPKGDAGAVGPAGAASTVPGPKGDPGAPGGTGPAGTNANLVAATLTTLGSIKANIQIVQRTTAPISVSVPAIAVLGVTALVASVTVTVPGVVLGDWVQATFAGSAPAGLIPTAAVVTAADRVLVTFGATQALTLAAGAQSLGFVWMR